VVLANPIASQMGVMRSSLIGGLVNTLGFNLKRRVNRVRVFEIGRCFQRETQAALVPGFAQAQRLACLAAGPALPEQWGEASRNVDFYDIKRDLEALFAPRELRFEKAEHAALHPGRSASVWLDGAVIGSIGELHPRWAQKYELGTAPVVFEIDLAPLLRQPMPRYREVSRYPSVVRDLALLVRQDLPLQPLLDALRRAAPAMVRGIELFDVYQGKGVATDQKSLAFRIVMQDTEKTLADGDADAAVAGLLAAAAQEFGASLRT
jgi:phenylalanyl-tRNA synthetase beta chain